MSKIEQIKTIFLERFPKAESELQFKNHFELIVSVVLSAQCTDKRVNIITPQLFESFPNPQEMAKAEISDIEQLIKSCNLFRNKAKYLFNLSNQLLNNFNGIVPMNSKELQTLSGVGPKTANVVLIEGDNANLMAVDTHVFRVAHRLGLSKSKTATGTEKDLTKAFKSNLGILHQAMVLFGRYHCKARNPNCGECFLAKYCLEKDNYEI